MEEKPAEPEKKGAHVTNKQLNDLGTRLELSKVRSLRATGLV